MEEPMVRILVCNISGKVIELDPYEGDPDGDWQLRDAVSRLQKYAPNGVVVGGATPEETAMGDRFLFTIPRSQWNNPRIQKDVLSQFQKGYSGFQQDFYDVRNFIREDAVKCYIKHGRPTLSPGCNDYMSESKVMANQLLTDEEWTAKMKAGITTDRVKKNYLCSSCPYHSAYVQRAQRAKTGLDQ